jgi:hypothetical protein
MPDKSHKSARKTSSSSNGRKRQRESAPSAAAKAEADRRAISSTLSTSTKNAAKIFEHFSLSKFPTGKIPANYVNPKLVHDAKAVQDAQRKSIETQLRSLPHLKTPNAGVTITFPTSKVDEMKKAVPGLSEKGGEVKVDALLAFLGTRMNGRSFYAGGNPALTRLTTASEARDRAKAIIEHIKNGPRANGAGTREHASAQSVDGRKRSPKEDHPGTTGRSKS